MKLYHEFYKAYYAVCLILPGKTNVDFKMAQLTASVVAIVTLTVAALVRSGIKTMQAPGS